MLENKNPGRPTQYLESFQVAIQYLVDNDDEQITVGDLVSKMTEHCGTKMRTVPTLYYTKEKL